MDCKICYNNFNETLRRPRNLICGHSFCSGCLKNIIQYVSTVECPECRSQQKAVSVEDLPVAYGVLRAIEAVSLGTRGTVKEDEEDEDSVFILPRLKESSDSARNNAENDIEVVKKSYRNVLWSKIYTCGENIEELQSYNRTIERVILGCKEDVATLDKLIKSRQMVMDFLREEVKRSTKEQEEADKKKEELLPHKNQVEGTLHLEEMQQVLPRRYLDLRFTLDKFLNIETETLKQLRSFTSCICRNDKNLLKSAAWLDVEDLNLASFFTNMTDID